jgi:hypothetical protein
MKKKKDLAGSKIYHTEEKSPNTVQHLRTVSIYAALFDTAR